MKRQALKVGEGVSIDGKGVSVDVQMCEARVYALFQDLENLFFGVVDGSICEGSSFWGVELV